MRQLEAEFRSGRESDGQAQLEAEPKPAALEASREQQALALLGTHDAKAAEFLRAQLAEARGAEVARLRGLLELAAQGGAGGWSFEGCWRVEEQEDVVNGGDGASSSSPAASLFSPPCPNDIGRYMVAPTKQHSLFSCCELSV